MEVKRNYKDSVFCRLFNDEDVLGELYSTLSGKNYTKETKVEIVTYIGAERKKSKVPKMIKRKPVVK